MPPSNDLFGPLWADGTLTEAMAMVKVDEAVVARLTSHGSTFEILVDSSLTAKVRRGEPVGLDDLLAVRQVFKDAKKGDRVSDERILEVFGTHDLEAISRKIIRDGEIQLTTDQRRALVEEKRKAIVAFISRNAVDPRTGYPHPPTRVDNALTEGKARIDPFEAVETQVKNIVKELRVILPLRFEVRTVAVKIPPEFTGRAYGHVKSFGDLKKEEWQKDGSWIGVLEIPVGVEQDFYSLLGKLTQGQAETKLIERR